MMDWTNWIFDLDGTLVSSDAPHAEAFRQALKEFAPKRLESFDYTQYRGSSTQDAATALGFYPGTVERDEFIERKRQLYLSIAATSDMLLPGARELLEFLSAHGRKIYLVTGASGRSTETILTRSRISHHFLGRVVADDVRRGKPDPQPYRLALQRFGLEARTSVVIEDSIAGVASARGAGLFTLSVGPDAGDEADRNFHSLETLAAEVTGTLTA